jgi:hypothetical protein
MRPSRSETNIIRIRVCFDVNVIISISSFSGCFFTGGNRETGVL